MGRVELNKPEWKVSNLKIETSFEINQDIGPGIQIRQLVPFEAQPLTDQNGTTIEGNIMDGYKKLIDQTTDKFDPMLFHIQYYKVSQYDRRRLFDEEDAGVLAFFCQFDDAGVNRRRLISGPDTCHIIYVEYTSLNDRQVAENATVTNYNDGNNVMSAPAHVSREIALDTENYVKIADNWMNRAILCAVLFWVVCGPFALVWAVMKYQKKKSYQKVAAFVDTETENDSK